MLNLNITTTLIDEKGIATRTSDFDELIWQHDNYIMRRKLARIEEYAKWILEDINRNLEEGKGLNNMTVAPLKESTIKKKGSSRLFVDKGILLAGITMQKMDDKYFKIFDSSKEGYFVQSGLSKGNTPRVFFGISENIKKKILDDLLKP